MATIVQGDMGASEIILRDCSRYIDSAGVVRNLDVETRAKFAAYIKEFAQDALRFV
jgi:hypothetical protein